METQTQPMQQETSTDENRSRAAKKQARRERKRLKKAARRDAYRALSTKKKLWYWGKRILIAAACLAALTLVVLVVWEPVVGAVVQQMYEASLKKQASEEEILEIAKPDEAGAARVAALPAYNSDDTWAIYIYMCGSNLESFGENDLSDITSYLLSGESAVYENTERVAIQDRIVGFVNEINAQGMDLPDSMYLAQKPQPYEDEASSESTVAEQEGCATADLKEMLEVALPQNVQLVIQTGGATRWSHAQFNPNRSQRFLCDTDGLHKLSEGRVQNMGASETLRDFLSFCKEGYPADHTMLLFWNHGSGAFGMCADELFGGDQLTLSEMDSAFADVYEQDPEDPPFELIGFDACLMASAEVAESLYGFGRYMAASEEVEPGEGWNHTAWLTALAEHPEMNGAQLGKVIADSYIEYYANRSIQLSWAGVDYACTFSVIDVDKAHTLYGAYGRLAATALAAAIDEPTTLVELGRAVDRSVRFADAAYAIFNTVDLGLMVQNLTDAYPVEAGDTARAVKDCVLYSRATSYGRDAQGVSVYFPAEVSDIDGLSVFLEYIHTVCNDPDIRALYYYKVGGCLNEELQAYASAQGYGTAKTLDTSSLNQLAEAPLDVYEDGNYSISVDADVAKLMQSCTLCIAQYDESAGTAAYFGEDLLVYADDDERLVTGFDGEWFAIDGHFLPLRKIADTDSVIEYRAPVNVNGEDCYLLLAYDRQTDQLSVLGKQKMDYTAYAASRNVENIKPGDTLKMIYRTDEPETGESYSAYGKSFVYGADSRLEPCPLDDGEYLSYITVYDLRSNEYYSPVVQFTMQNGQVRDASVSEEFVNIRTAD